MECPSIPNQSRSHWDDPQSCAAPVAYAESSNSHTLGRCIQHQAQETTNLRRSTSTSEAALTGERGTHQKEEGFGDLSRRRKRAAKGEAALTEMFADYNVPSDVREAIVEEDMDVCTLINCPDVTRLLEQL